MKIYLATWLLEPAQGEALFKKGSKNRLISYFHTKEKEKELKGYILKGQQRRKINANQ